MQANEEANSQLWGSAQTLYNCCFGIIVDRRNSEKYFKNKDICFYFDDCFSQSGSTNDLHWLVNCIQLS